MGNLLRFLGINLSERFKEREASKENYTCPSCGIVEGTPKYKPMIDQLGKPSPYVCEPHCIQCDLVIVERR